MARSVRLLLLLAFGCSLSLNALSPNAMAEPTKTDDVAGDWLFDTSKFEDGLCQISGRITFTPTSLANTYTCVFESEQICDPAYGVQLIRVKQSCTAQRVGKQVAIKSKVANILAVKPLGYVPGYLADNFVVTLSKNMLEMVGGHYDEQRQLKARFWRDVELMS